jgi:hypothetical protein
MAAASTSPVRRRSEPWQYLTTKSNRFTYQTIGRLQSRGWVRFGLWNNWVGGSKSAGLATSTRDATFDAE